MEYQQPTSGRQATTRKCGPSLLVSRILGCPPSGPLNTPKGFVNRGALFECGHIQTLRTLRARNLIGASLRAAVVKPSTRTPWPRWNTAFRPASSLEF